jgi:hypothetical protein
LIRRRRRRRLRRRRSSSSSLTPLLLLFFLSLSFPAGPRPLPLTAAPILWYQGAREMEGGPGGCSGAVGPGPTVPKWEPEAGRGAVVGGRKREETGRLTEAAPARRLPPHPLRLSPTWLSSSRAHCRHLGRGPPRLAGSRWWGAALLGLAREEGVEMPESPAPRPPRPQPGPAERGGSAARAARSAGAGSGTR